MKKINKLKLPLLITLVLLTIITLSLDVSYKYGLKASYLQQENGELTPYKVQIEKNPSLVNTNFFTRPDNFKSVTWSGYLKIPTSDYYLFSIASNGPTALYLNNNLCYNYTGSKTEKRGARVYLEKGFTKIKLIFNNPSGKALLMLWWSLPEDVKNVILKKTAEYKLEEIPYSYLYPEKPSQVEYLFRKTASLLLIILLAGWFIFFVLISDNNPKKTIIILCSMGILVRLLYVFQIKAIPHSDMATYESLARNILQLKAYTLNWCGPYYLPPFYPIFLASIFLLFKNSILAVRLTQAVIGGITCILIYFIGKKVTDKKVAIFASLIAIFFDVLVFYTGLLLVETLMGFFICLMIWMLLKIKKRIERDKGSWLLSLLTGILIGIASLTKPIILPFILFILLWLFISIGIKKVVFKNFTWIVLGSILILLPWVIRNYRISGKILLTSTNGGSNFYMGNNPFDIEAPNLMEDEAIKRYETGSIEWSAFLYQKGWRFIKNNPKKWLKYAYRKFKRLWFGLENPWPMFPNGDYKRELEFMGGINIPLFNYKFIFPFLLLGLVISIRTWRKWLLFYLLLIHYSLIHIMYFAHERFRTPLLPILILFAGLGICSVVRIIIGIFRHPSFVRLHFFKSVNYFWPK
ncbi:MAG: glycosyltransferase family 39 protein [bacterium]